MKIVITGANRGIGLELARQYLARGDSVLAGVRTPDRAGELAALHEPSNGRLRIHACDVALETSVRAFAAAVTEPVELLINNAGVRIRPDSLEELDLDAAALTSQVNALGRPNIVSRKDGRWVTVELTPLDVVAGQAALSRRTGKK
jgi:NAD(P)-dependent dehydrogenase (short-subunit alcohol dehydrogenase family)